MGFFLYSAKSLAHSGLLVSIGHLKRPFLALGPTAGLLDVPTGQAEPLESFGVHLRQRCHTLLCASFAETRCDDGLRHIADDERRNTFGNGWITSPQRLHVLA
jgi:hypothetical protein